MARISKREEIKLIQRAEKRMTEIEILVESIRKSLRRIEGSQ
ncbi:MAG: hypothetical protein ACTSYL_00155 [Candidatus Thorarchaeota archaeon]